MMRRMGMVGMLAVAAAMTAAIAPPSMDSEAERLAALKDRNPSRAPVYGPHESRQVRRKRERAQAKGTQHRMRKG
jgi:hypothetical protein